MYLSTEHFEEEEKELSPEEIVREKNRLEFDNGTLIILRKNDASTEENFNKALEILKSQFSGLTEIN